MTDLLNADEARVALGRGATDVTKGPLLNIAIKMVTQLLEGQIGPVVYGTITNELYDGGGNVLHLKKRPVASVVQVVEYDSTAAGTLTAESNTTKPTAGYLVDLANGRLIRRNGNGDARFPVGRQNVSVTYVAGRCQATLIPELYKWGAAETLKANWRMFEASTANLGEFEVPQASFPTFSIPNAVKDLLSSDWQVGSGGFDG